MYWERDGVQCKGRADMICTFMTRDQDRKAIVDLKTTTEIQRFDQKVYAFNYDKQAAWYQYGYQEIEKLQNNAVVPVDFYFLAVDVEPPFLSQFILVGNSMISNANSWIADQLDAFKAYKSGELSAGMPPIRVLL